VQNYIKNRIKIATIEATESDEETGRRYWLCTPLHDVIAMEQIIMLMRWNCANACTCLVRLRCSAENYECWTSTRRTDIPV